MNHRLFLKDVQADGIFDLSLTPGNANGKGYEYVDDINYDLYAKNNTVKDILKFLHKIGYKLGMPFHDYNFSTFYGLYAPIKQ